MIAILGNAMDDDAAWLILLGGFQRLYKLKFVRICVVGANAYVGWLLLTSGTSAG